MAALPQARRGDGKPIHPGEGVVPIIKALGDNRFLVLGTAFYLTRYGLFMTAKHVVEDLANDGALVESYVVHLLGEDRLVLRRIRKGTLHPTADLAICQAENFVDQRPSGALMNLRPLLSIELPPDGARLATYAYPENEILDFSDPDAKRIIAGDYFVGGALRFVRQPEHPYLRTAYLETSVEVRGGASGGPLFDDLGRIVGVNSRGWDFRGGELEGQHLSYIIPIGAGFDLPFDVSLVPPGSWEEKQLEAAGLEGRVTLYNLARIGHLRCDSQSSGP